MRRPMTFINQKARSVIRLQHLNLPAGMFPLFYNLPLPHVTTKVLEKCLDLWHPLFGYYKNFMKLLLYWIMEFRISWICVPSPKFFLFWLSKNVSLISFELRFCAFLSIVVGISADMLQHLRRLLWVKTVGEIFDRKILYYWFYIANVSLSRCIICISLKNYHKIVVYCYQNVKCSFLLFWNHSNNSHTYLSHPHIRVLSVIYYSLGKHSKQESILNMCPGNYRWIKRNSNARNMCCNEIAPYKHFWSGTILLPY